MQEETCNNINRKKIRNFAKKLKKHKLHITYFEKNLGEREDEIERLKVDCQSTLCKLQKCRDFLKLKKEALVVQDERIIRLEDFISSLKKRIQEISVCKEK